MIRLSVVQKTRKCVIGNILSTSQTYRRRIEVQVLCFELSLKHIEINDNS